DTVVRRISDGVHKTHSFPMDENYCSNDRTSSDVYVGMGYTGAEGYTALAGGNKVRACASGDTDDQMEIKRWYYA
ncbi:MAG: hypothetical protein ACKPKO_43645, partial [Candidatus Fonsibacter sp.]